MAQHLLDGLGELTALNTTYDGAADVDAWLEKTLDKALSQGLDDATTITRVRRLLREDAQAWAATQDWTAGGGPDDHG